MQVCVGCESKHAGQTFRTKTESITVKIHASEFKHRASQALHNSDLQRALAKAKGGFIDKRRAAVENLPEFTQLSQHGREIKEHTLQYLDFYLERFEQQVHAQGGQVHWASTSAQAREIILNLCQAVDARSITKGKSMISEEIDLNACLEAAGFTVVETDLGEYIIQLADEPPSHIIAPAVHKTREEISALFHQHHQQYGLTKKLTEVPDLVNEARQVLRNKYLQADVGITGANFLIAETGATVIVTNEGNGDLTNCLPKVHIVTASIDKVVPTLEDMTVLLRLLGRSATGQTMSTYTTLTMGTKREGDISGAEQFHVVLVDNGRSTMLGNEFKDMLRCIRCGACMNHCPVYGAVGGHAYGWVYPGPMGSVLTPLMIGLDSTRDLPNACTLNGRCESVCPMHIPLAKMLRQHRVAIHHQQLVSWQERWILRVWAWLAGKPHLYRWCMHLSTQLLAWWAGYKGRMRWLPFASGWTCSRDIPAPQGGSFIQQWQRGKRP